MILVIDNYDSFTYNLVQYLGRCGATVTVRRNDEVTVDEIVDLRPDGIMLSPGPCTPSESGICLDIVGAYLNSAGTEGARNGKARFPLVPLFGVCLGHQAIGQVAGGVVRRAGKIMHGKASLIRHDGKGLFRGMPNPFSGIRYHSLVVASDAIPQGFIVTATAEDDGEVMGLRHESLPIEGVQFHPESVLTESGFHIVENFVSSVSAPEVRAS